MTDRAPPSSPNEADACGLAVASRILHSVRSQDELIVSATRALSDMLDAEGSSLVLRDPADGALVFHVVVGSKSNELKSFRLADGEGITGHCIRTAAPVVANDAPSDPRFSIRADHATGFHTRSVLAVPICLEGSCIGACTIVNSHRSEGFSERDRVFAELIASHIAVAIRNVQLSNAAVEGARLAALGQAVAGAAHCMKNLVLVLKGGLYIVRKELEQTNSECPSLGLEMLEENVGRLSRLVQDMLTYAKDSQQVQGTADLGGLVRSAVASMEPAAVGREITLATEVDDELGPVEIDSGGIHRCILNLLSNAIDACEGPGASVRVAARRTPDGGVVIEVADEGCGMDSHTLQCLFQPFFTTKGARGTGLGLSVTSRIVDDHGGRIEVDSEPGKGSTFRVYLPGNRPPLDLPAL